MAVEAPPAPALTERSALDLARSIRAGEVSSREVVEAHIEVLQRTRLNAVVFDRYEQARAEADAADARVAEDDRGLPPLHGVPFTVKESIRLRGMPNSGGLVARREFRSEENAPAAERLLEAGLIPLGVTNVSEMTMWIESDNRVYGRTLNAYDRAPHRRRVLRRRGRRGRLGRVAGGTRVGHRRLDPAAGVLQRRLRPQVEPGTWCRSAGMFPKTEGEAGKLLAVGPLTRRAEDLMPVLRTIAGAHPSDPDTRDVELGDPGAVVLDGSTSSSPSTPASSARAASCARRASGPRARSPPPAPGSGART